MELNGVQQQRGLMELWRLRDERVQAEIVAVEGKKVTLLCLVCGLCPKSGARKAVERAYAEGKAVEELEG
jgi:hypothetical protein